MAQVINKLPNTGEDGRGRATKYPWDEWCDGRAWIVTQDEDFDVELSSFTTALHQAGKARGLKVRTRKQSETSIAFQFYTE